LQEVEEKVATNALILSEAQAVETMCRAGKNTVLQTVEGWINENKIPFPMVEDYGVCTLSMRNETRSLVIEISGNEAFTLTLDYSKESKGTVSRLVEYSRAKESYDARYADNKTQFLQDDFEQWVDDFDIPTMPIGPNFDDLGPKIDRLVLCTTMHKPLPHEDTSVCPNGFSAYEWVDRNQKVLLNHLEDAMEKLDEFIAESEEVWTGMQATFAITADLQEGIHDWVNDLHLGGAMPDWFDITLIDLAPFNANWPYDVDEITGLLTLEDINSRIQPALTSFNEGLHEMVDDAQDEAGKFAASVKVSLNFTSDPYPEDYNPPQYADFAKAENEEEVTSPEEEQERHALHSATFENKQGKVIETYLGIESTVEERPAFNNSFDFSEWNRRFSNFNPSTESLMAWAIDFDGIFLQIGNLSSFFVYADMVYRIIMSIRLLYYYWGRGAVRIPEVDLLADKESTQVVSLSTPKIIGFFFLNPFVYPLFIVLVSLYGSTMIYSAYIPLAEEYTTGCVNHGVNGTTLTNNLYSLAYNYASENGNDAAVTSLTAYDRNRSEYCSLYSAPSVEKYNIDEAILSGLKASQNKSRHQIELYGDCIDVGPLDLEMTDACCGLEGYDECTDEMTGTTDRRCPVNPIDQTPYPLLDETLSQSSGYCAEDLEFLRLDDAFYDCEELPLCYMMCEGPDKAILRDATDDCGCKIQWLGHTAWMQFILAVFIYAILNVSRIGLVGGMCKIFWRSIHNGLFTYKATCAVDGTLIVACARVDREGIISNVKDGDGKKKRLSMASQLELDGGVEFNEFRKERSISSVANDASGFQNVLKEDLSTILPRYRNKGFPQVLFAIAINGVWIYAVMHWSAGLAYVHHKADGIDGNSN
jgi:hypothetical protein